MNAGWPCTCDRSRSKTIVCNENRIKIKGSLADNNPQLALEWKYEKNGDLLPSQVTAGSGEKVWWQCPKGHTWSAIIRNRNNGTGCPYCLGRKPIQGYNDLATTNSKLATEWHKTKNGKLTPKDVTAGSSRKAWWQCPKGHEWEASVINRNAGSNCPFCTGTKVLTGVSDLATQNPKLAAEWHKTKNGKLTPKDVTAGSNRKAWWQCPKGHEWSAVIANRSRGNGCPRCYYSRIKGAPRKIGKITQSSKLHKR